MCIIAKVFHIFIKNFLFSFSFSCFLFPFFAFQVRNIKVYIHFVNKKKKSFNHLYQHVNSAERWDEKCRFIEDIAMNLKMMLHQNEISFNLQHLMIPTFVLYPLVLHFVFIHSWIIVKLIQFCCTVDWSRKSEDWFR